MFSSCKENEQENNADMADEQNPGLIKSDSMCCCLDSVSSQLDKENVLGEWHLVGIVNLSGNSEWLVQSVDSCLGTLCVNRDVFHFNFKGYKEVLDWKCSYDSVQFDTLANYGEKDLNPQLKGTSWWTINRDSLAMEKIVVRLYCKESWLSFERVSSDTIGYFSWDKLYLFSKDKMY